MPIEVGGHYEVEVKATLLGEDCSNKLCYACGSGSGSLEDFLADFRTLWRAQILPLVSDQYVIEEYRVLQLEGVIWKSTAKPPIIPPVWPNVRPLLRFDDREALLGDPVDDIGDLTTAEFPSYVAVGAEKLCGPVTDMVFAPLAYEKAVTGSIRFGGAVEAQTDDNSGNELNAAAITAWQGALDELVSLAFASGGGTSMTMEVWSLVKDGAARAVGMAPAMARAPVTSLLLNQNLTHQITRGPRRGQ